MQKHSRGTYSWLEALIVGLCIAALAVVLQAFVGKAEWPLRLIALVCAAVVLGLIQFGLSIRRKRQQTDIVDDHLAHNPPDES